MPASACVSTSSVKKTFVTPSRWINVGADVFIVAPCVGGPLWAASCLTRNPNAVERVLRGHVRQNNCIAGLQPVDDLDLVHRAASQLDGRADSLGAIGRRATGREALEERHGAILLAE